MRTHFVEQGAFAILRKRARSLLASAALAALCTVPPAQAAEPSPDSKGAAPSSGFVPSVYKTFAEWKAACDRVPANRSLKFKLPPKDLLPLKSFAPFGEVIDAYFRLCKTSNLAKASAWLGRGPQQPDFFNTDAVYFLKPPIPFQPFVQRATVPAGSQVLFHGDMHGDIHALVSWIDWLNKNGYLRDFKIIRPDTTIVFLGDYTDRGMYGVEVLYTMLRLKLENPDRVLMVRGNHEDVSLAARYGFIAEGRGKYPRDFDPKKVMRLYDFLPPVLYLGCESNFLQCNHGGMEPGFDPRAILDAPEGVEFQLLGPLRQQQFLKAHPDIAASFNPRERRLMESSLQDFQPESPTTPAVLGFMWNDFAVVRGEPQFDFDPGRAFIYGENASKFLMAQGSTPTKHIRAVFRAHQHATILNSMMRRLKAGNGIYRHWQETDSVALLEADPAVLARKIDVSPERSIPPGSVWTFNVAPDSVYGDMVDFSFDTFGILTTAKEFEGWRLRVVNQPFKF